MSRRRTPEERRAIAGKKAGAALERAAKALRHYTYACRDCGDEIRLDDDRLITRDRMTELAHHLAAVFGDAP